MAFPDVPIGPGIPVVPRDPNAIAAAVTLVISDALAFLGIGGPPKWGLFQGGAAVVVAESVVSFGYRKDWTVATFPIEKGAFQSYDKVENPFDVRLRFASGADDEARQAMLASLNAIAGTTQLFDAVTPEATYPDVNVMHLDYDRTAARGAGLLVVDVWVQEIRNSATAAFSTGQTSASGPGESAAAFQAPNTKSPAGASPVSGGLVQPQDAARTRITVQPVY